MATTNLPQFTATEAGTRRTGRSAPDWVMFAGLLGAAADFTVAQFLEGTIIPPALAYSVLYALIAGVVATGWRWSGLVPLVLCSLALAGELAGGHPEYALTHPSDFVPFVAEVLHYSLILMVIVACVAKLIQMRRSEAIRAPRWMAPAIATLAGLAIGALLVGATAAPSDAGGVTTGGAGTKTVHLTANRFAPDIVALHTGETLLIVGNGGVPHILANGSWSADSHPVPGVEQGAPVVNQVEVNGNSIRVGPFATEGTYHIYCTIHPGMVLTVVVR